MEDLENLNGNLNCTEDLITRYYIVMRMEKAISLSPVKTYLSVITGRNRIGDHLGSIDLGFEYDFKNIRLLAYRQNLYDAGALYHFANIRDGLNGLSLTNTNYNNRGFQWRKILVEVLYTKNQAGEFWSPLDQLRMMKIIIIMNNILQGWSYKGLGIGNPFIADRILYQNWITFRSH